MRSLMGNSCNGHAMFTFLLFTTILFSCSKEGLQEPVAPIKNVDHQLTVLGAAKAASNIIFEETFEGSTPFVTGYDINKKFVTAHAFKQVTRPVFAGSRSGRFELRDSDPMVSSGTRAEIRFPLPAASDLNRWYSFAIYLPSADYQYDDEDEVLNQWHQGSGYSPSISLRTKDDRFWLYVKSTPSTTDKIDLGVIPKDRWNTFVYHINHSSGSNGLIELWINGTKVLDRNGANMYDISRGKFETPRWNIGIYKSAWNNDKTTKAKKRVVYYDNIKLGNGNATLAEMSPGTVNSHSTSGTSNSTQSSAPTMPAKPLPHNATNASTPSITSLTLINAHNERDIMTITNGTIISLSRIGAAKLNIRANATSSSGNIKFELAGAQSKTYTDKAAPFALHGDSGTGNYYFGNWNPPQPGIYTLKATPYTGANATGQAGKAYLVRFTITQ